MAPAYRKPLYRAFNIESEAMAIRLDGCTNLGRGTAEALAVCGSLLRPETAIPKCPAPGAAFATAGRCPRRPAFGRTQGLQLLVGSGSAWGARHGAESQEIHPKTIKNNPKPSKTLQNPCKNQRKSGESSTPCTPCGV